MRQEKNSFLEFEGHSYPSPRSHTGQTAMVLTTSPQEVERVCLGPQEERPSISGGSIEGAMVAEEESAREALKEYRELHRDAMANDGVIWFVPLFMGSGRVEIFVREAYKVI
jgi:hypothetical protein